MSEKSQYAWLPNRTDNHDFAKTKDVTLLTIRLSPEGYNQIHQLEISLTRDAYNRAGRQ